LRNTLLHTSIISRWQQSGNSLGGQGDLWRGAKITHSNNSYPFRINLSSCLLQRIS
jgi:hypothetical protein